MIVPLMLRKNLEEWRDIQYRQAKQHALHTNNGEEAPEVVELVIQRMANAYETRSFIDPKTTDLAAAIEKMRKSAKAVSHMRGDHARREWKRLSWWSRLWLDQGDYEASVNAGLIERGNKITSSASVTLRVVLDTLQALEARRTGPEKIRDAIYKERGGPPPPIVQGWA